MWSSRRIPTFRRNKDLTLYQLRIFLAVAEREHMTSAAHDLDIAQSAVSAAMAALEAVLDVRLFQRAGRNIRLSRAGCILRAEARDVMARIEELRRRVRRPDGDALPL